MANNLPDFDDLKDILNELKLSMDAVLEGEYPSDHWLELEEKLRLTSSSIQHCVDTGYGRQLAQKERDSIQYILEGYRQMIVIITAKTRLVSEELRKFRQRQEITSVYNKA